MSKVLKRNNLKENSSYCFALRNVGNLKGTFLKEKELNYVIKTKEGINEFPKSDLYFYHKI